MTRARWFAVALTVLLLIGCRGNSPTARPPAQSAATTATPAQAASPQAATPRAASGSPATARRSGTPASPSGSPARLAQAPTPTETPSPTPEPTATPTPEPEPTPTPEPPPPPPPPPGPPPLAIAPLQSRHIEYGFNVFLSGNPAEGWLNTQTMAKVREAGFGWVRVQLQWAEFEPAPGRYNTAPYDAIIGAAANGGANVLVSVVKAPAWAAPSRPGALPQDTQAFGRTMRYLASRYGGAVQAWEIWNEQNLAGEVGGYVEIAPYFETLKAGYAAVKSVTPNAFVLFGGLTPTGVMNPAVAIDDTEYLRQFYTYAGGEGRNYFDVLAAHPGSAANPPETKWPENPGSGACPPVAIQRYGVAPGTCWRDAPDFYFRRIEDQRAVMEQFGDGVKQIWLTEFGWDSCVGLPAPNGYEYCALTGEEQQAAYIVRAFDYAYANWPWMGVMLLWNLNYAATPSIATADEKYGWSVLRGDWSNRPAFEAIKAMPK